MTQVSCLSQLLCSTCEGHLNDVYKIFGYLQNNVSKNPGRIEFETILFTHKKEGVQGKHNRVGLLEVPLTKYIRFSSEEEVGTTGGTYHCLVICRCKPCRERAKQEVPLWNPNLCQQCNDKLLQQDTEHSLIIKFWFGVRGIKNVHLYGRIT